jgi:hypothetical protein
MNKNLLFGFVLFLGLILSINLISATLTNGLVSYWKLDEGTGNFSKDYLSPYMGLDPAVREEVKNEKKHIKIVINGNSSYF